MFEEAVPHVSLSVQEWSHGFGQTHQICSWETEGEVCVQGKLSKEVQEKSLK